MNSKSVPMVSVLMLAYNHAPYIRQALDGVIMQRVNFTYEILIHDDASNDGTADIIREYEMRYPKIIKPIYQNENQYSKGASIVKFNRERAFGKYVALCECDDCWTDANKLQIQVDFLENHPEYVATTHKFRYMDSNGKLMNEDIKVLSILYESPVFTLKDAASGALPGHTATVVHRNIFLNYDQSTKELFYNCPLSGDRKLSFCLVAGGDIYCIDRYMSNYRCNLSGDSWSSKNYQENMIGEAYRTVLESSRFMKDAFGITLDNSELALSIIIKAYISSLILHDKNLRKELFSQRSATIMYLHILLRKLVTHPIGIAANLFKVYKMYVRSKDERVYGRNCKYLTHKNI